VTFPGGNPPRRPDQLLQPLSRAGTGPAPQSAIFIGHLVIIFGTGITGLFQYEGTPSHGNGPILWAVPPGVTTDPFGNTLPASGGIVSEAAGGGLLSQLSGGSVVFGDADDPGPLTRDGQLSIIHRVLTSDTPILAFNSPAGDTAGTSSSLWLLGAAAGTPAGNFIQAAVFARDNSFTPEPVVFILCGSLAFGSISGGIPTPFGPVITGDSDGMYVTPGVSVTTPTRDTATLWEIQGSAALKDQGSPPVQVSGYAEPYATAGNLMVLSGGDGGQYDTQVYHLTLPSTSITDVTPISTNIGTNPPVVSGQLYKFHVRGMYTGAAAGAGIPRFLLSTPAVSSAGPSTSISFTNGSGTPTGGISGSGTGPVQGISPMAAGTQYIFDFWGEFTPSASGSVQFQANTSAAADNFQWNGGTMELYPVN
jgi:hypothetical protein